MTFPIDNSRVRPHQAWYAVAGVVFAVSVLAGCALSFRTTERVTPGSRAVLAQSFGTRIEHPLQAGRIYGIYVPERTTLTEDCTTIPADAGELRRSDPADPRVTHSNSTWVARHDLEVRKSGLYGIMCGQESFVITDNATVTRTAGFYFNVGVGGVGCLGVLIAGGVLATVAILRDINRRRLLEEAARYHRWGPRY
ncbi:hypothetical protein [Cryptosporangium aurantiacum]|uniref:Uncharacterized protein n=1 Tax=Cryptosporangium aurantiacum TaxID=134849 RepID=A0A1M7PBF9_9ACTN|nr:hypothetical protein [Cryptosporangium aurantiacum]SHN14242.1 hypothetical protein SAMN05443668_103168 [Cryptosporangium aurantiacum]